jgi:hypothetical protein
VRDDYFGGSVATSGSGTTIVVGAFGQDSSATNSGAAYVYGASGNSWVQTAMLKAAYPGASDGFGDKVSVSENGQLVIASSRWEQSSSVGIGGNQSIPRT